MPLVMRRSGTVETAPNDHATIRTRDISGLWNNPSADVEVHRPCDGYGKEGEVLAVNDRSKKSVCGGSVKKTVTGHVRGE